MPKSLDVIFYHSVLVKTVEEEHFFQNAPLTWQKQLTGKPFGKILGLYNEVLHESKSKYADNENAMLIMIWINKHVHKCICVCTCMYTYLHTYTHAYSFSPFQAKLSAQKIG